MNLRDLARELDGSVTIEAVERRAAGGKDRELDALEQHGEIEIQPLGRRRRSIAARMSEAWRTMPHVTQHGELDVTRLDAARRRLGGPSMTALLVKASALALREHPRVNSSLLAGGRELALRRYVDIGVAVDVEVGIVAPVVRRADERRLADLDAELQKLASAARRRGLSPEQLRGAGFTITNLGGLGGTHFTPIINPPQVAILGACRAFERGGRTLLPISLSYDHRVLDGADAMRFINTLAERLAEPLALA